MRILHVTIGTWDLVGWILVRIVGNTVFAVSVVKLTGLETTNPASPSSRLASDHDLLLSQEKVSAFIDQGPISLNDNTRKRKAVDVIDVARYRRGFIWGDKLHHNHISPAVLYTETAPPLPSPPLSLIEDPTIQASLRSLG